MHKFCHLICRTPGVVKKNTSLESCFIKKHKVAHLNQTFVLCWQSCCQYHGVGWLAGNLEVDCDAVRAEKKTCQLAYDLDTAQRERSHSPTPELSSSQSPAQADQSRLYYNTIQHLFNNQADMLQYNTIFVQ